MLLLVTYGFLVISNTLWILYEVAHTFVGNQFERMSNVNFMV